MEKHSMRHLLWTALFLLYCSCGCLAAVVQQLPQKGESALQAYTVATTAESDDKNGEEWKPIRIAVYTKLVEDIMEYCERKKKQDNVFYNDLEEKFEQFGDHCEEENANVMTPQKKDILFKEVLPKAIKLHADRLSVKVKQEEEDLKITNIIDQDYCVDFKIPEEHKTHGIPDVDFMIYVSLSTNSIGRWICSRGGENRPTSALIKFVPEYIEATRQYIRLTAHEIAHGLGFDHKVMETLVMIEPRENDLLSTGGSSSAKKFYMNSSETLEILKKHYNCKKNELKGFYLENEPNERAPPHCERRIAKDELMSAYSDTLGVTGMYYTKLTLAVFHSMPFYSANFNMAEPMSWGKDLNVSYLRVKRIQQRLTIPLCFAKMMTRIPYSALLTVLPLVCA
ncbi:surface protease GP63 [Trypanosoma theileri]|uniref:Leishmanolysin-like peptidase n=1 Tax=Trypanosoma theileri TaxID=67003 RepID=A0A1X0NZS0_9TRYP|nr:surface protease GP63 [Trypanosoma theileri]ORC89983.1 surface protease GP63 [Trypanosoma theileri]